MDNRRWQRPPAGLPEPPESDDPEMGMEEPEPVITEGEYLQSLVHAGTPIAIHMRTGEVFHGKVEYYDQRFIRLTRVGEPNLFIFKKDIKYFTEE
jgi:sRNA-binding regulator protein Hfq